MKLFLRWAFWLGVAPVAAVAADSAQWFEIRIADQPAGYQHVSTQTLEDGSIVTTDETVIVLNRLSSRVEVRTRTETCEAVNGEMISVREESSSSEQTVVRGAEGAGR